MTSSSACPGCGAVFPDVDGPTHPTMESSPACWAAFCEVLSREYSTPALFGIHRLSVDAYAVQHPGKPSRQTIQSVTLHLIRLLLQVERGLPPERANDAMLALAEHKARFRWLEPPPSLGSVTVADVAPCVEVDAHEAAVRAWAASALAAWSPHRATLEEWLERLAREPH